MPGWDTVIVGGGHNGLTAAGYLARAGQRVLLLERNDHVGGAAVSHRAFPGMDARLSRYSYLVSLLPRRIIDDLGLRVTLLRRRVSSYTPDPADPRRGLLVDGGAGQNALAAAFARVEAAPDAARWTAFYRETAQVARAVFPSLVEPLPTRSELHHWLGTHPLWDELTARPLGDILADRFESDLVRSVAATDGLIGTFCSLDDPSLAANRCFLYHVIGGGTGDWDVPAGGMGAITGELERVARSAGATIRTRALVTAIDADSGSVLWSDDTGDHTEHAQVILSGVAPSVLAGLLGESGVVAPEGSQVKVNLLLARLPRLRDPEVAAEAAFAGTFHANETQAQLEAAYGAAADGGVPTPLPVEVYCHTLSDPGILGPELRASGSHTMTAFGLHTPHRLAIGDGDALRDQLQAAVLSSLNSVLAEPIEDVIAIDASGKPCIETRTTADLEDALAMPGGHIFHGPLSWPWVEDSERLDNPARRWGVATAHPRLLCCGSGAVRGGAVSGIGGHNAAMAVLEEMGRG